MSTIITYKNICGHTTTIKATEENNKTKINVQSTCKTIMNFLKGDIYLSFEDINNSICKIEKLVEICENNTPTCFLPTMIVNASWFENGLLSKNLAKKNGLITIEKIE